ncbi:MAG: FHA domain-containing protein [Chloroflexota bacterium]|nr:FHA domain-containing protein [Chloroflexota bacterium]
MKKNWALVSFCVLAILFAGWDLVQAQERGPVVDILGKPETTPPNAHAYVSVIDPDTGRVIDDLSADSFTVQVSGQDVDATASLETKGVAVVIVIDRGGIAQRGDPRIGQAVDLTDELLGKLDVDGSASADMVALIGIRGQESGGLTPLVELTDFDPIAVSNEFDKLRTEIVGEVTPLYDGIDQAIEWITENSDSQIQEKLTHRRPIIVIFSDGIDNQFSSESHETIIINKCIQNDVLLYAVRMEAPGRRTDADNLEALALQTNGIYTTHNADTHDQVLNLFEDIVTQRQSYRLTFPLYRPQGDYDVRVQVLDYGADETRVSSQLQLPELTLAEPTDGSKYTVPYSQTLDGFESFVVNLSVQVTSVDEAARDPAEVRYFANGVLVGTGTTPPDFTFAWNVSSIVTPTEETQAEDFTLLAEADDTYLNEKMASQPVNVHVTWGKMPPPPLPERVSEEVRTNWWMVLIMAGLLVGLLLLFILLIRTRGEVARKVVRSTTGVLKGVTRRLGTTPQSAPGKLVVIQGANMGKEFRLAAQVIKVGRDPQFCDFALYDEYSSNPHFSVQLEQTQFYITDEGSTNGTRVNGMPIQPHQRVLLQPDAIIELGQTRLQFKRLGGTTRHLDARSGEREASPSPGTPSAPPPPTPGLAQPPHPPTPPAKPHRRDVVQGPPRTMKDKQ